LGQFAHHTFSHRLRIAKPDAAIYLHAVAGLQESPSAILFIDDKIENIEGARATGMTAIQFTTYDALVGEMQRLGIASDLLIDE
jgi:putative hydrolase of the HAD superfamily